MLIAPLDDLGKIRYRLDEHPTPSHSIPLELKPIDYALYSRAFEAVQQQIRLGNTYLLNLTFPTAIPAALSLESLYEQASARFKLFVPGRFLCFSPERFITITNRQIHTYPMKGTIPCDHQNAQETLLDNPKEKAEHIMIVDLLRNDLSRVATQVRVKRFRYLEPVGGLWQASSEIVGQLNEDWQNRLGDILDSLLPAGSITGAPKRSTCAIISEVEPDNRGFFTGVAGVFDGENLQSFVLIRYIEQSDSGLLFRSGGGIVQDSDCQSEYAEMLAKAVIPAA